MTLASSLANDEAGPLYLMFISMPLVWLPGAFELIFLPKLLIVQLCLLVFWARKAGTCPKLADLVRPHLVAAPLALLALTSALSVPGSLNPLLALAGLLETLTFVLLYLAILQVAPPSRARLILAVAVGATVAACIGIAQFLGASTPWLPSLAPPGSTFANRNLFGEYLGLSILMVVGLMLASGTQKLRAKSKAFTGACAMIMGVALICTRTRGAWAGLLIGLVVAVVWGRVTRLRVLAGGLAIGLVVGVGLLAPSRIPIKSLPAEKATLLNTVRSSSLGKYEMTERMVFWAGTARMAMQHAAWGVGPEHWKVFYPPYDRGRTIGPDGYGRNAHSDLLLIWAERGTFALMAQVWLLGAVLVVAWRCRSAWAGVVAGFVVMGLVGFPNSQPGTEALFWAGAALCCSSAGGPEPRGSTETGPPRSRVGLLAVGVLVLACLLTVNRIEFDAHFLKASSFSRWPERATAASREAIQAIQRGIYDPDVYYLGGIAYERLDSLALAAESYQKCLDRAPWAWYAKEALGGILLRNQQFEDSIDLLSEALRLCPKAAFIHNNLAIGLAGLGRLDEAEWHLRQLVGDRQAETNLVLLRELRARREE